MTDDKPYAVFVSSGTPHTPALEDFVSAVEAHLKSHACIPQTVGRSSYSLRQPVQAARDLIGRCDGAVVIAFERTRIMEALDKPGSDGQRKIKNESHPTVWNQMEAAMAYAQRVPILTFVQPALKRQGMLSDRLEWKAIEADLTPSLLRTEEFRQVFREWLSLMHERRTSPNKAEIDPGELRVGVLISRLKAGQLWSLLVALFAVLAGVAGLAFKAGQWFK